MSMRIVGQRSEPSISFSASAELLAEGARFNDELLRLPGAQRTRIAKGVYRFMTHAAANRHLEDCIVDGIVQVALERR